jgi:hypothetical protein
MTDIRKWQPCNSIALALESLSLQEEMTEDLWCICQRLRMPPIRHVKTRTQGTTDMPLPLERWFDLTEVQMMPHALKGGMGSECVGVNR